MRVMYGCALLCAMLSCDNPASPYQTDDRCERLESRVAALEARTESQGGDLEALRRRTDKERTTAAAETAQLTTLRPVEKLCPNPFDEGQWSEGRLNEWRVSEPPAGFPELKIYYGVWHEDACLPATSPCRGLPEPGNLDAGSLATCGYPFTSSWSKLLRSAIDSFYAVPKGYLDFQNRTSIYVAYGLLGGLGTYNASTDYDFRTRVLPMILRSRRLTGIAYDWAMSRLKEAWQLLEPKDRQMYFAALTHGQRYLASFSERRESAYLERLEAGTCPTPAWYSDNDSDGVDDDRNGLVDEDVGEWNPKEDCPSEFVRRGPDGEENPYRKLEAFFFRRARQGVKVADMKYWLDRVVAELQPLTPGASQ